MIYKALGSLGGPTAVKYLEEKVTAGDKEDALLATRALGERRDPAVLPFALKVAGDPKADKTIRDEMFGVVEGIGGLDAEKGLVGDHLVGQGRDRPLPRVRIGAGGAQGRRHPARRWRRSRPARPTRRSTWTICW